MAVDQGKDDGVPQFSLEERAKLVRKISAEKYRFLAEIGHNFKTNSFSPECPYPREITVYGDEGWHEEDPLEKRIDFAIQIVKEKFDEATGKEIFMPRTEEYIFYQDGHSTKTVFEDQILSIKHHDESQEDLEKLLKTMEQVKNIKKDPSISGITKLSNQ